jgi:NTE family protein
MNALSNDRKIGLALGGGAVLGAAHIGVMKVLDELDIHVEAIAGTSIGALIAALYAFGKDWRELEEIALHLRWLDAAIPTLSQFGLLSNRKLRQTVIDLVGDVDFSQAHMPLAMIAVDISTGEKVILDEGKVADAVMASTCIPGVFTPIEIEKRMLVDGGLLEIVPVSPFKYMEVETVIAVDLLSGRHTSRKPHNLIDLMLNSFYIALRNASQQYTEEADILIAPDLVGFNPVDTHQVPALIERGYEAAQAAIKKAMILGVM